MNRLAKEQSPYLLQHAGNPVDWYPWSDEAFARARSEGKPVFLSVGYSTCHWCHVMEHESFEDENVAGYLKEHFISIKVDREERPEIDNIYMGAVQAMSGNGGWPMTVFLTPELKPFYAGTYFPATPAYGRPSFLQLIIRIAELWNADRAALIESSETLTAAIRIEKTSDVSLALDRSFADRTFEYFSQSFDEQFGGFGRAPKFPRPVQFDFLFNYWHHAKEDRARDMGLFTLRKIAEGGIHDHAGGGFHRYAVDRHWRVSHFEKMLYDQAQLVNSFLDAYQISHEEVFAGAAIDTIDYVLRDLRHPLGGFFSAEDADYEGEEGKYYVWTLAEIQNALGDESTSFIEYFGITSEGNFEHGKNVLHISGDVSRKDEFTNELAKLFEIRSNRVRPLLDDKVLTSWNGLMIGVIARASSILARKDYLVAATTAGEFVWKNLRSADRLLHRWRNGEVRFDAYLEDYAFLIQGYIELYESTFDDQWLERCKALQKELDEALWDDRKGGYFMSREAPDVLFRAKTHYDGAEPAGNSIAALNLLHLATLTESSEYREKSLAILQYFAARLGEYPYAMPELMVALLQSLTPARQIIFAGERVEALAMKERFVDRYLPSLALMYAANDSAPFAKSLVSSKLTAYLCENMSCELPVHTAENLLALLDRIAD